MTYLFLASFIAGLLLGVRVMFFGAERRRRRSADALPLRRSEPAIIGFLLMGNAPLGNLLWPPADGPDPEGANLALLMAIGFVEALAFGLGVTFLACGRRHVQKLAFPFVRLEQTLDPGAQGRVLGAGAVQVRLALSRIFFL
jgi:hypothetical protein